MPKPKHNFYASHDLEFCQMSQKVPRVTVNFTNYVYDDQTIESRLFISIHKMIKLHTTIMSKAKFSILLDVVHQDQGSIHDVLTKDYFGWHISTFILLKSFRFDLNKLMPWSKQVAKLCYRTCLLFGRFSSYFLKENDRNTNWWMLNWEGTRKCMEASYQLTMQLKLLNSNFPFLRFQVPKTANYANAKDCL